MNFFNNWGLGTGDKKDKGGKEDKEDKEDKQEFSQ